MKNLKTIKLLLLLGLTPYLALAQYTGGSGKGDACDSGTENTYLTDKLFTGNSSTDFSLGANWVGGTFPVNETAIVPPTAAQQPVLSSSQTIAAGSSIIISSGASLTVTPAGVLTVNGTLNNSGTLTLQSDASGSASIGNSTGTITGNAIVQRFVPAMASPSAANNFGRRWRFISSPVQQATLQDVRQEMFVTGPGTGTTLGTVNSNGFDANHNNNATIFRYNESTAGGVNSGWIAPSHIDSTLVPGLGYRMFVRGDRGDINRIGNNSNVPQNAVTLDFRGPINQGNITMPVSFTNHSIDTADGWNLLGNPYPCAIDWDLIHDAGRTGSGVNFSGTNYAHLQPTVWVWNPITNTYGSYNALSNIGHNGMTNGVIASGQSFWVKATQAGAALTITESHKTTAAPATGLFKNTKNSAFFIQLIRDSFNRDEMAVKYLNGSTTLADPFDTKLMGSSIAISAWDADSVDLSVSCRPLNTSTNDTIRLRVQVPSNGTYTLRFINSDQIAVQEHITLVDGFANTLTDLRSINEYLFAVNTSTASSSGHGRFYIVVSNNNPVPVELISLNAQKLQDEQVQITWQSAAEVNFSHYEIEKSTDAELFVQIDTQKGRGNKASGARYSTIDNKPNSTNYYRLKMIDRDGSYKYSHMVVVNMDNMPQINRSEAFPNPSTGSITIQTQAGSNFTVVDVQGRIVKQGITDTEMRWNDMEQGVFFLRLEHKHEATEIIKIVITK